MALERLEVPLFRRIWFEALILAILLGAVMPALWPLGKRWFVGINFSAKTPLEFAVMLLGSSISAQTVMAIGPTLLGGIAVVVLVSIAASYGVSRLLGLPRRMATLVACGNVIVVLCLPVVPGLLHINGRQYGVLAGLTVYAVPQVLAATAPLGAVAVHIGTLVKLVRVLMLGPVVLGLSMLTRRWRGEPNVFAPHVAAGDRPTMGQLPLNRLVPWYIVGFLMLAGLRSVDAIPHRMILGPTAFVINLLTVVSMAALGLGTDLRSVMRAGVRVCTAVATSLLLLGGISLGVIHLLGIA
jgi:uncharacterized membrane protein YadS